VKEREKEGRKRGRMWEVIGGLGKDDGFRFLFWNVAGIGNKSTDFWRYIVKFDFISLCETWVDEKGWEIWKERLPSSHVWACDFAIRNKKKGRAKGGFIIGIRKMKRMGKCKLLIKKKEGVVKSEMEIDKEMFSIISVYGEQGGKNLMEKLEGILEEGDEGNVLIGGDFNLRLGSLGKKGSGEGEIVRHSKDRCIGNGGRKFIDWLEERGWVILNGCTSGDWEGEFTYVGTKGCSVIDYVMVNERVESRVSNFSIGEGVDSDHMPMELNMEMGRGIGAEKRKQKQTGTLRKMIEKVVWNQDTKNKYMEKTREVCRKDGVRNKIAEGVEEKWERIKGIVLDSMIKKRIKIKNKELGDKDWWDGRCTKGKRKLKRIYWKWRKCKVGRKRYIEERKNFRTLLTEVQKEKREREEEELRNMKREADVWKFINRKRGVRKWMANNIGEEDWRDHFMKLLEGEEIMPREMRLPREEKREFGEEIRIGEVVSAIKRLKIRKAAGLDKIPMEAWKFASEELVKELTDLMNLIGVQGELPKDWKMSVILPLYKRGDKEITGNYRGISLLCSAYKVYAEVIRNRLEVETVSKDLIPESQAGFRKGRSTLDNIFILNHVLQRELRQGGGNEKVYLFFVDLKAAFDRIDRNKLMEVLRRGGVKEELVRGIERIYKETIVTIRTGEGLTRSFKTAKGVRQGCVMSPLLFNIYMAELEERFERRGIGGVGVGNNRVWNLAYADDLVILAKNREAMLDMLQTLKRFLKERDMELNTEKSKMLVFNRKRKEKKERWEWNKKEIEEVQEFKYLGFILNKNGNCKDQIRELRRKGRMAAKKVWGLGERICRNDFKRRWNLFKYLVQSVMGYGAEIWGWEEKPELEKIMCDYVRWMFGIDFCTPRYIIARELGLVKLNASWGIRASRFEERIKIGRAGKLAKECWVEKEQYRWSDKYGKEKEKFWRRIRGDRNEEERPDWSREEKEKAIVDRIKEDMRRDGEERIWKSRYNQNYKEIMSREGCPRFLREGKLDELERGEEIRILVKLRCGNLEMANRYWLEETAWRCIFCRRGKDTLEHHVGECERTRAWFTDLGEEEEERLRKLRGEDLDMNKGRVLRKLWREREKCRRKDRSEEREPRGVTVEGGSTSDM